MPFNLLYISLLLCKMGIRFLLASASQVDEKKSIEIMECESILEKV